MTNATWPQHRPSGAGVASLQHLQKGMPLGRQPMTEPRGRQSEAAARSSCGSASPEPTPSIAYLALGANLGDPVRAVQAAMQAIAALPSTHLRAVSSLYRTAPIESSGPDYVNAVVAVETTLSPLALLHAVQAIEKAAGRERPYRNAPRTLDIDVLCHGTTCQCTPELELPHPRMMERAFVLVPLAEIAPHLVPPDRLAAVQGQGIVRIAH